MASLNRQRALYHIYGQLHHNVLCIITMKTIQIPKNLRRPVRVVSTVTYRSHLVQ